MSRGSALNCGQRLARQPKKWQVLGPCGRPRTNGAADALYPAFEAPAELMSVRARRHSPLHARLNRIQESQ